MTQTTSIYERYSDDGVRNWLMEMSERACEQGSLISFDSPLYWTFGPKYYRWLLPTEVNEYDCPPEPFKIVWVAPEQITRFTRREHPTWWKKWWLFGNVAGGNWDQDREITVHEAYAGDHDAYREIHLGERFRDTEIFQSLKAHFIDGIPWEDTNLIRRSLHLAEEGNSVWQVSKADIHEKCVQLDALYADIREHGYRTQEELMRGSKENLGFLMARAHEVQVDIGRDGEFLFVDGRHRLAIAKILGLDAIPIVILLRHEGWMERRERAYRSRTVPDHPDMRDINELSEGSLHTKFTASLR